MGCLQRQKMGEACIVILSQLQDKILYLARLTGILLEDSSPIIHALPDLI